MKNVAKEMDIFDNLRKWAVGNRISHTALRGLLKLINDGMGKMLPHDLRTFLVSSATKVSISKIGDDGEYWHNSLEKSIRKIFEGVAESKTISININMDGLPLFKSSKMEFWPILFNITEMPEVKLKVIGIYCGNSKCPDLGAYLRSFVAEMKGVMNNGIIVNSHKITVLLRAIIYDSSASSFVKG